ncbi:integrase core domain-containing protein [Lipingzhangella rawalii]|uniref:integrase core domain-containing protein n=1 Tax=Lipingzhangella rawalii TaxID=2055835 RepID=UPI0038996442
MGFPPDLYRGTTRRGGQPPRLPFLARATVFFAAHGVTHIHRLNTDNGACCRSQVFSRIVGPPTKHRRTQPFKPQHNGKAERQQRVMAIEVLYAQANDREDERPAGIATWTIHDNDHRPHSTADGRPPASRLHTGVTKARPSQLGAVPPAQA